MKKFFALMCLLVIGAVAFTSCDDKKDEPYANHPIVGTWRNVETLTSTNTPGFQEVITHTVVFNADGSCTSEFTSQATGFPEEHERLEGTFDVNSDRLTLYYMENGKEVKMTDPYKIEGSKLTISNSANPNESLTYDRVK